MYLLQVPFDIWLVSKPWTLTTELWILRSDQLNVARSLLCSVYAVCSLSLWEHRTRALASAGLAGNHRGMPCTIGLSGSNQSRSDLQVGSRLDAGELVGQGVHGRAVLQQLVQHKVQQGGLAVCALHVCQLQQCIQLEPCAT